MFLNPAAVGDATADLLSLARRKGVERAVLLSALTVQYRGGQRRFADQFRAQEDAVKASGLPWTLLRCSDFAANTLAWAPQIRFTRVVRGAHGDAATSPIHERDVAAVAACGLLNREHAWRSYVVTGPQSLSRSGKLRLIAKLSAENFFGSSVIDPRPVGGGANSRAPGSHLRPGAIDHAAAFRN